MKNKKILKRIYTLARLQLAVDSVHGAIEKTGEFDDCCFWGTKRILKGCYENGNVLYSKDGKIISRHKGNGYYCNQSTGYCEDDFYGNMYYIVDKEKGIVVDVEYHC